MYGRLQSEICQRAIAEIRGRKSAHKFLPERIYRWLIVRMNEREVLPKEIDDIFERELVQEEIREHILEEICNLILTLEKRRVELSEEIREYKQRSETSSRNEFRSFYILLSDILLEFMQREALSLELILDKLHRNSSIIEQIHRRVLDALYRIALKQFNQWENTQRDIDELHHQLILCQSPEKSPSNTSKLIHQHHRIPVNKPLSKHQFNYFKSNYVYSRTHK
jgi:chorismate mutase